MDRADTCEQQARDANLRAEKVKPNHPAVDYNCYQRFFYATGRGGGPRSPEEDAAARKRSGSGSRSFDECQQQTRREGQGSYQCESRYIHLTRING